MIILNIKAFLQTPMLTVEGFLNRPWSQWFSTALVPAVNDRTPASIPGPYANDAAAAAAGISLGALYYVDNTHVNVRLT